MVRTKSMIAPLGEFEIPWNKTAVKTLRCAGFGAHHGEDIVDFSCGV